MSKSTISYCENTNNTDGIFNDKYKTEVSKNTEVSLITDISAKAVFKEKKPIVETMVQYRELMMMYTCAMKEIRTKFEVLNTEFNVRYQRNPIQFISSRLKQTSSVTEKLMRKGLDFSLNNIENNIHDMAGVRIICAYIDDIYLLADSLVCQDDITLIKRKDYITNPKPNGYRSLHLIVSVPVFFAEQKRNLKVEVQIRTIAMDFWASLEHQLKYKHDVENQQEIISRLRKCADIISGTDIEMLDIRKNIEFSVNEPSEEDILFEKLRNIDAPII